MSWASSCLLQQEPLAPPTPNFHLMPLQRPLQFVGVRKRKRDEKQYLNPEGQDCLHITLWFGSGHLSWSWEYPKEISVQPPLHWPHSPSPSGPASMGGPCDWHELVMGVPGLKTL